MFYTEPMFLINDQHAEFLELDVLGENPVGANDYVDLAPKYTLEHFLLFGRCAESG